MIHDLNTGIIKAFEAEDYYKVIHLVDEALKIPNFGFTMETIYRYGYSLLRCGNLRKGIIVLEVIATNDTDIKNLKYITSIINKAKYLEDIEVTLDEFLRKGYILKEETIVYLSTNNVKSRTNINKQDSAKYYPFMIWKIEDDKVYAFPLHKYKKYGHRLPGNRYLIEQDLAAVPNLVTFDISELYSVFFEMDPSDYKNTLRDLYERFCIFGQLEETRKNEFVLEMEKKLSIEVGDIIVLYNPCERVRRYYYVANIDIENSLYKCFQLTHHNGDLVIKEELVQEIPMSAYIMEKIPTTPQNREKLFR